MSSLEPSAASLDGLPYLQHSTADLGTNVSTVSKNVGQTPIKASTFPLLLNSTASQNRQHLASTNVQLSNVNDFWGPASPLPQLTAKEEEQLKSRFLKLSRIGKENEAYSEIAFILNTLSKAHIRTLPSPRPDSETIVFFVSPNNFMLGDRWQTMLRPDLFACSVPDAIADKYLEHLLTCEQVVPSLEGFGPFSWCQAISLCDWKKDTSGHEQILDYLIAGKRYRFDIPRISGLIGRSSGLSIYHLSAAGCSMYEERGPWSLDRTPTLQRYVGLVYKTHHNRLKSLSYIHNSGTVWQLEIGHQRYFLIPFVAKHPPGRTTAAFYAVEWFEEDDTSKSPENNTDLLESTHICKLSWPDDAGDDEATLYAKAHGSPNAKVPGLATVMCAWETGKSVSIRRHDLEATLPRELGSNQQGAVEGITQSRSQKIIILNEEMHLLTSCDSDFFLLRTLYDACKVHEEVTNNGVLHRDLSPWNVGYLKQEGKISGLESGCLPENSSHCYSNLILDPNGPGSPLALLTDLDSAVPVLMDPKGGQREDLKGGRREITGTPGFISFQRSNNAPVDPDYGFSFPGDARIRAYLREVSTTLERFTQSPSCSEVVSNHIRALQINVQEQMDYLDERARSSDFNKHPHPDSKTHRPCHDVESLVLMLWFLFARANPEHEEDEASVESHDKQSQKFYTQFCNQMLTHRAGQDVDTREALYSWGPSKVEGTLHPRLRYLALAIYTLVKYCSIPDWHFDDERYKSQDPLRAHRIMQMLLLYEIIQRKDRDPVKLNTKLPRPARRSVPDVRQTPLNGTRQSSKRKRDELPIDNGRRKRSSSSHFSRSSSAARVSPSQASSGVSPVSAMAPELLDEQMATWQEAARTEKTCRDNLDPKLRKVISLAIDRANILQEEVETSTKWFELDPVRPVKPWWSQATQGYSK